MNLPKHFGMSEAAAHDSPGARRPARWATMTPAERGNEPPGRRTWSCGGRCADPGPGRTVGAVQASARILTGNVVQVLSDIDDVDVLFCGSRGYGPARRILLGGVSSRLVRRAPAARSSWYRAHSECRGRTGSGGQEVEPPDVVLDRRDDALGETGLSRVCPHRFLAHHGAGAGRVASDHPHREAVQDAHAVVQPLHVARVQGELFGGPLVG